VHDEIFESEVVLKKPAFVIGQDSYTPSAMDMCTPFRPQQCVILQFFIYLFIYFVTEEILYSITAVSDQGS
jgi:hypothetical protein